MGKINILIRHRSGRIPQMNRCIRSIMEQTYKNVELFVGCDFDTQLNHPAIVRYKPNFDLGTFFYNDYCNILKEKVQDGWFLFLDDDDCLASPTVLEELAQHFDENCQAIICQMSRKSGKVKPSKDLIASKKVISGKIGMPCLVLRAEHKAIANIPATENGDFIWIKEVTDLLETKFINQIVVYSPQRNFGR